MNSNLSNTVFFGGLTINVINDNLTSWAEPFGNVSSVRIIPNKTNPTGLRIGFVEMENAEDARACIEYFSQNPLEIEGITLTVAQAREPKKENKERRSYNRPERRTYGRSEKGSYNRSEHSSHSRTERKSYNRKGEDSSNRSYENLCSSYHRSEHVSQNRGEGRRPYRAVYSSDDYGYRTRVRNFNSEPDRMDKSFRNSYNRSYRMQRSEF